MHDEQPIIEIRNLWFSYNGASVLSNVNLTVHRGNFLALIGPNGGGKTTLLKIMLGLLKPQWAPEGTLGIVRIFGEPPHRVSHRIGYAPQNVQINTSFPISVEDIVLMGTLGPGGTGWARYSKESRRKAEKALKEMDMWEKRKKRIGELSGGQRQRVFVARALVSDPELLFLDEPTAGVDPQGQSDLYDLLKELNKEATVIVVSHDMNIISSHVKSVACVNRTLFYHDAAEITGEMLDMSYLCPVELVAHGLPHRVLKEHDH